ncbi:MAG: hypothetical protein QM713_11760 [Arachnia sp.]
MAERLGAGTPRRGAGSRRRGGISDARLARARELHRQAIEAEELAARLRAERDALIKRLRAEDPETWSYGTIAAGIGCSRELIALVAKRKPPSG